MLRRKCGLGLWAQAESWRGLSPCISSSIFGPKAIRIHIAIHLPASQPMEPALAADKDTKGEKNCSHSILEMDRLDLLAAAYGLKPSWQVAGCRFGHVSCLFPLYTCPQQILLMFVSV